MSDLAFFRPISTRCIKFAEFQPTEAEAVLLIHRNSDDEVKFIALNQLTTLLLQVLAQQPGLTLEGLVGQLWPYVPQLDPTQLLSGARQNTR